MHGLIMDFQLTIPALLRRAVELFDAAMKHAWDDKRGGIFTQ